MAKKLLPVKNTHAPPTEDYLKNADLGLTNIFINQTQGKPPMIFFSSGSDMILWAVKQFKIVFWNLKGQGSWRKKS